MDPDALIAQAREQTALDDLGGDGFREGLGVLARSLDEEAELHDVGRPIAKGQLLRALTTRLRVVDWLQRHPEILEQAVPAPIFVLGLPRTGTTALSGLLASDPATRSLRTWESSDPVPPPEAATQDTDPRIERTEAGLAAMHTAFPQMRAMHDSEATGPTECQDLLALDFRAPHVPGQYHVPSYDRWVRSCDMVPAYRMHKRVLQLLQSRCPPTRWHLKTPVHMLALPALLEVYPDARFVMTHRDPARVLGSVCSLIQLMYRMTSSWDDPKTLGREQLDLWTTAVGRAIAFRDSLPEDRFVDVPFAEQLADPIAAAERVYDRLGLPFTPEVLAHMRAWTAGHARGRHGEHRYDLADFGLDAADVHEHFRFYLDRFEVPEEDAR
jgi:hypothetical protein